jgi:hypothetical protein
MKTLTLLLCSSLIAAALQAQIPTDSLVGWWPFNGNANDESNYGHDGTVNGAVLTTDRFGNLSCAYSFNGYDSYIDVESTSIPNNPEVMTQCAWIKTPNGAYQDDEGVILTRRHINDGTDWPTLMVIEGKGVLRLDDSYYAHDAFSNSFVNDGNWHFLVGINYYGEYSIYLDGQFQNSIIDNHYMEGSVLNLHIGHHGAWNQWWNGILDDIRIYNRSLSESEILALYHEGGWANQATFNMMLNDQIACINDSITFEVKAEGIPPIHYQWQKDAVNMPDASDSVLILPLVQAEDAGEYRCIAFNDYGTDTSNTATLYVITDSLMLYCTFDDVNSITNPVAGPGGTFNANPETNFTTGQVGNAYFANYYESDLVSFPKVIIPPNRGCIEFWGKLNDMPEYTNDNWGSCPSFFRTVYSGGNPPYTIYDMGFGGNNGHEGAGLCGCAGQAVDERGGSIATGSWLEYQTFSSILGDVYAWHHYAMVWDINGIPGSSKSLQIFLDGIPVGSCDDPSFAFNYCPIEATPPTKGDVKIITNQMGQGSVAIDEFKIWNYAKTQFIDHAYIYTVLNDQQICKNDNTAFEVKTVGIPPIYYQWQKDGIDISGASDNILMIPHVQPEDAGEYRCIATNDYGTDTSNIALLTVEFAIPTNIQGFTNVTEYQIATYSVEMQPGHGYEFVVEGGNKIDGTENFITVHWGAIGQGLIKLIEISELGCYADTNTLNVTIGPMGIDDQETQNLSVYPNPFTGITTFFYAIIEPSQVTLKIYNSYGQLIDAPVNGHQQSGNHQVQWNAEGLPAGAYFYRLTTDDYQLTTCGKLVKY